jgi:biopolymer transport protein ExbD
LQINLPEAKGDTAKDTPDQISVDVDASGNYRINSAAASGHDVDSLTAAMTTAGAGKKDPVVVINADAQTTHQSVVRVMDAARRAGYTRVTFVTQTDASNTP